MPKYRITKYNPCFRDADGCYLKDEWTSISDIGKSFSGKTLSLSDYLKVEDAYLQTILAILCELNFGAMCAENLELCTPFSDEHERALAEKGIVISLYQKQLLEDLYELKKVSIEQFKLYFQLQLRECFWCTWTSAEREVIVETGYDYYMYIICEQLPAKLQKQISGMGLFVEEI